MFIEEGLLATSRGRETAEMIDHLNRNILTSLIRQLRLPLLSPQAVTFPKEMQQLFNLGHIKIISRPFNFEEHTHL